MSGGGSRLGLKTYAQRMTGISVGNKAGQDQRLRMAILRTLAWVSMGAFTASLGDRSTSSTTLSMLSFLAFTRYNTGPMS